MYGTDARFTHYLGELDYISNDRSQLTPVEVWGIVHTPWLFSGGIDIKAGQWVTLEGAETIDPTTNYFYSHSYIFNFGILRGNRHHDDLACRSLARCLRGDTGVNTTFGTGQGDNNGGAAFAGGIGLNLLGGNLTILATTHINGTNNTTDFITACHCNPNNTLRFSQRHHGHVEGHRLVHSHHLGQLHFTMMVHTLMPMVSDLPSERLWHRAIRRLQGKRLAEACRTRRGLAGQQQFLCRGLPWQF